MFTKQLRDIIHQQKCSDTVPGATRPGSKHRGVGKCSVGHSTPTHVEIKLNFT